MTDRKTALRRGRPRGFEEDAALATGERLFHAHGYDGMGLAALTAALGIGPASFYAAFGSKARFFERILARYVAANLPLDAILHPGRDPAEAVSDLLHQAARAYALDPAARGCLVLEALHAVGDADSRAIVARVAADRRARLRGFLATTRPAATADAAADLAGVTLAGLSACAREGWEAARLLKVAGAAAAAIGQLLAA